MIEKQLAAEKSTEFIENGMILGLGTGSTVLFMLNKLGEMIKQGLKVKCISSSLQTTRIAKNLNIPLINLNEIDIIDLTIDGADEVDYNLNGIKGGGGALLFEKIIATCSNKVIWIVDSFKFVEKLGKFPLPVEVIPFASTHLAKKLDHLGFNPVKRILNGKPFLTDSGNEIIDLYIGKIEDPINLEKQIKMIPGVVEVGLFNNIADMVIIGRENSTEVLSRKK